MSRVVALFVLVAAFAPAAVLGALPLVILTMVSGVSMLAAVVLALPRRRPLLVPSALDDGVRGARTLDLPA